MKEKVENLGWFSRMEELVEALEDLGLEVLEANREYVVVGYEEDEEDVQLILQLADLLGQGGLGAGDLKGGL